MAAQQTPDGHDPAAQHSEAVDGLHCIVGASGNVTARRRKQGRNPALISPQRPQCRRFHFYFSAVFLAMTSKARFTSSSSIENSTLSTDFFGLITTSIGPFKSARH